SEAGRRRGIMVEPVRGQLGADALPMRGRMGVRMLKARRRELEILSTDEVGQMREAGLLASRLLAELGAMAKAGITTAELDEHAVKFAQAHGVRNAPLGYKGFPRSICTSRNEVVCHGIPSGRERLEDGDIISIDVTLVKDGF